MTILTSGIVGFCAGAILLFLSHLAPKWGIDFGITDIDRAHFRGRVFSRRESHLVGIVVHLLLYCCFGIVFGALVTYGMLTLSVGSMAIYALLTSLFLGGVIIPLEGHGFFRWHEDHWFILDLIITNGLWMFLFGMVASVLF